MFGFVTANYRELTSPQQDRYGSIYCGICREIGIRCGTASRLALSYDMAFLAALLMSLYEPEEASGKNNCLMHPLRRRPWVSSDAIAYAADMNVALGYYNCLDDWQDDGNPAAKILAELFGARLPEIEARHPRQCAAIRDCIGKLSVLEKENCPNPDLPAGAFGELMGQLLAWKEDFWAPTLYQMGNHLGRFIYLMDAAMDYDKDRRKGKYNPFLAMGTGRDPRKWEQYLVLTMGRCTQCYEKLPLLQDKDLLDNILYSGVWVKYRGIRKEEESHD